MTNKKDYTDVNKYNHHKSMNGKPLKANEVLVPFWIQKGSKFKKNEIIKENCTTYHLVGYTFIICFIPIDAANFESYMQFFYEEINKQLKILHTCNSHKEKFQFLSLDKLIEDGHFGCGRYKPN